MRPDTAGRDPTFVRRLRWQTGLVGAIIFLVPFVCFYLLVGSASRRYVRGQSYERLQAGATTNSRLLDDVFEVRKAEIESLAGAIAKSSFAPASWSLMLRTFVRKNPWYECLAVVDDSGEIMASCGELQDLVTNNPYFAPLFAGETITSDRLLSLPGGPRKIVVVARVSSPQGKPARLLVADLRVHKLTGRLLDLGVGASGEVSVVNSSGHLVVSSSPESRAGTLAFDERGPNPFRGSQGTAKYRSHDGQVVLSAYRQLRQEELYLVAQVAEAEVLARADELRRSILVYLVPFLALGVGLAVLAWHFGINYIGRLTGEVYDALKVAQQRERERDLAHQELARRFELERELAQQKVQFQAQLANYEKNVALAQLALGAAHEINNPLLGILTHLELKAKTTPEQEERANIDQCIEAAKRIASTVRGLLNYARPDPLRLAKVDLRQLVEETLAFLQRQPLLRGRRLVQESPASLPAITADPNQISQILMNLLLNAADATPAGGQITVSIRQVNSGERVEISISDTGHGIPPEVLPHVFDPFFTTKRTRGTGLGLSITQTFVRSHHGDIQIESEPGQGTTVRITLPVEQEEQPVLGAPRAAS